jgi:hypothetical protein
MKVQDLQIEKFSQPADSKGVQTLQDSANSSPPVCFVASSWSFKASTITWSLMANIQKRIPGMAGCTQWGQHDNELTNSKKKVLPLKTCQEILRVCVMSCCLWKIMFKSDSAHLWDAEILQSGRTCRLPESIFFGLARHRPPSFLRRKKSGIKVFGETCKCLKREWPWFWRCSHP